MTKKILTVNFSKINK